MTSKLTREQLIKKAQEQIAFCRHTKITGEGLAHVNQCAALFEIALAAMDSEPVAWLAIYHGEVYDEAIGITRSVVEAEVDRFGWEYGLTEIIPLYRHAQPAPVVPDGLLSMAASAIEDLLEHTDPNTSYYSGVWADVPGKLRAAMLQAGNSTVIGIDLASGPDRSVEVRYVAPPGYVMVPKEPTERMVIDGFESEPDETFSEPEVWEAYQEMSGCEQAAHRARLCWAAMLAAAPQEVK